MPPVGDFGADRAMAAKIVTDRGRSDRASRGNHGFKERTPEGQHRGSVRARPFRKENDGMTLSERLLHLTQLGRYLCRVIPRDEDRSGARSEPPEDRPSAHIALSDKEGGTNGSDHQDIDITEMVAGDEACLGNISGNAYPAVKKCEKAAAHPLHPGNPGVCFPAPLRHQKPSQGDHSRSNDPPQQEKARQHAQICHDLHDAEALEALI